MEDPEYMWLPRWVFPQEFIDEHDLESKFQGDRILARINKGMYGLPQAGCLAYVQLVMDTKEQDTHQDSSNIKQGAQYSA